MEPDDEPIKCLHCESDLRESGILEYGLQTFEIDLEWNADQQSFGLTGGEPRYRDCTEIYWRCKNCAYDLPTNPDDFADGEYDSDD